MDKPHSQYTVSQFPNTVQLKMTSNTIPPTYVSLTTRTKMEARKGMYRYIIFFEQFFNLTEKNSASYSTAASLSRCGGRCDIRTLLLRPGESTSISRTALISAHFFHAGYQKRRVSSLPRRMVNTLHVLSHQGWKCECFPERRSHAHIERCPNISLTSSFSQA